MKKYTCDALDDDRVDRCDKPAKLYACGARCDPHSPWALAGIQPPQPKPEWTAEGLRKAAGKPLLPRRSRRAR